ncbi:MAG: hypothetical protein HY794_14030 [Desulfarculus sp.]|nr:hypothetical protein [Desulfarculus sp.]
MSKIDQLQPGQPPQIGQTPQTARPQGAPAFQEILNQATQAAQAPDPAAAPTQAQPTTQAAPVAAPAAVAPTPLQSEGLLRAGRTLDLLDSYALALADQSKPLKQVAGLVKSLEDEARGLSEVLGRMDPQDGLYGLLREVAATAQAESLKFNRGDYVEA